jgi:hypothetical protein
MLITVIILGKYLECAAKGKTSAAIQALMSLAPDSANLVTLDEQGHVLTEDVVESALIHHGDLLKVRMCRSCHYCYIVLQTVIFPRSLAWSCSVHLYSLYTAAVELLIRADFLCTHNKY